MKPSEESDRYNFDRYYQGNRGILQKCELNKHEDECFIQYPNTEKWLKKRGTAEFFLTTYKVFGYRMKHPFECLI